MANVSKSFREHMMHKDFAPTFLCIVPKQPTPPRRASPRTPRIKSSKEGKMTLKVGKSDLIHGRLNVEALKALIEVPGMLSKVQQVSICAIVGLFDLGLSRDDLPLVKHISLHTCLRSGWYIESPSPLQLQRESSLQHLELRSVCSLTAETLNVLFRTIGSNLKTLKLSYCSLDNLGGRTSISDAELGIIGWHCHQLESLSVAELNSITGNGIASILQTNPRLIGLDIQTCHRVDGGKLVRDLARVCHQLQTLSLRDVVVFTAENLKIPLQTIGTNLKALNLYGCTAGRSNDVSSWRTISDAELDVIGRHCHQLESFSVTDSILVTANGISSVLRNNPGAKTLNVQDCPSINGAHLVQVLDQDCRQLQTLDLRGYNEWLTDSVLNGIIEALPELHTVFLFYYYYDYNNGGVTADGVRRALEQSSTLGRGRGKVMAVQYGEEQRESGRTWRKTFPTSISHSIGS